MRTGANTIAAAASFALLGCVSEAGVSTSELADNSPGKSGAGTIYLITPCAPIELLTKSPRPTLFDGRTPIFIDGKQAGTIAHCDFLRSDVGPGKHNVRVQLPGKSDLGNSSDAGVDVTVGSDDVHLVFHGDDRISASERDATYARNLLTQIRTVRGKS